MSYGSTYTNYYASYRMNPNNFEGSDKAFVEKHNANISNINQVDESSLNLSRTECGSPNSSVTSSGAYITHSYYGNCGHIISSCVG